MTLTTAHAPHTWTEYRGRDPEDKVVLPCDGDNEYCPTIRAIKAAYEQGIKDSTEKTTSDQGEPTKAHFEPHQHTVDISHDHRSFEERLVAWWVKTAEADIVKAMPKILEYGGYNMVAMGRDIDSLMAGRMSADEPTDGELQELAIWIYLSGKMGRAMAALKEGRTPSYDTVYDIEFYAKMIRRIRSNEVWP